MMKTSNTVLASSIRRSSEPPRATEWKDYGLERAKQRELSVPGQGSLKCLLRTSAWRKDEMPIKMRRTLCRLVDGSKVVSVIELNEFDLSYRDPEDVVHWLDAVSQTAYESADFLARSLDDWDFLDVFERGTFLELAAVWRHPQYANGRLWSDFCNYLLAEHFTAYAIAVLKAFPLEYESYSGIDEVKQSSNALAFKTALKRRKRAMVRMYSSRIGFTPALADFGEEGWMYRWGPHLDGPPALISVTFDPAEKKASEGVEAISFEADPFDDILEALER